MDVHSYTLAVYDFPATVRRMFDNQGLSTLGLGELWGLPLPGADQSTPFHDAFYAAFPAFLSDVYRRFVAEVAAPLMGGGQLIYQTVPTFRVHFPGSLAVGEFHKDRDYHHRDGELNFWVPLTRAWDTNTVWVETEPDKGDYQPATLSPGQFVTFDGVNLKHGNLVNTTGATRVSFDFRMMPRACYAGTNDRTIAARRRLILGDYWAAL